MEVECTDISVERRVIIGSGNEYFLSGDDGGRHENITACVCCPLELQGKFDLRVIYSAGMTGILK